MKPERKPGSGGSRRGSGRPPIHTVPMRHVTMYLPVDLIDQIDDEAAFVGMSRSMTVTYLIDSSLSNDTDGKPYRGE